MEYPVSVKGDHFKLAFPVSVEHFLDAGAAFLTAALHASSAIDDTNSVTAIRRHEEFFGGGMGRKLIIDIDYAVPDPALHQRLFVKFPREFGDPLRELFSPVFEPEIQFALLSRQSGFPVAVPRCYFADFDSETGSSILITEAIGYGDGSILPAVDKCVDYELQDALPLYRALVTALATLAASHKSGQLGLTIDHLFPPGAAEGGSTIPFDQPTLEARLDKLLRFGAEHPQLFPDRFRVNATLQHFANTATGVLQRQPAIKRRLSEDDRFRALCHWNANPDNAWFWHNQDGSLGAGLLDWGSVGQMNVTQAFFGLICGAETEFLDAHLDELVELFISVYAEHGGGQLDKAYFLDQLKLSIALLGVAWMIDAPSIIEAELPNIAAAKNRFDTTIKSHFLVRAQLHLLTVFLHLWQSLGIATVINRLEI